MTQVELDRTNEKANEAESKIQELEEQLNVVGQNMKTLELSETNALKRHEECEEKIRWVSRGTACFARRLKNRHTVHTDT